MDSISRRARLSKGRRIPLCVSLSSQTIRDLGKIARGNRSAAIEQLVREYHARRAPAPEPIPEPIT
jgi:hypothetical protein